MPSIGAASAALLSSSIRQSCIFCALLEMDSYQLLVTRDCLYTLRHLSPMQVQAVRFNKTSGDEQVESIRKIAALKKRLPGLCLVVGHDHTDYQSKYLTPFLAK